MGACEVCAGERGEVRRYARAKGFCAGIQEKCVTEVAGSSLNARNSTTQKKQWISFPDSALALVGKKNCGTGEQAKQILVGFKLARVHRDVYRNCGATRPLSRMSCSR
jgi:hypothetical protein